MLYREVPKNGERLSVLGYGCMRFPGRMQRIDEKLAERQILRAMDRGVNYYDTAYPYHGGRSEPFLGKVLERNGRRDDVKIATKLPHWLTRSKEEMDGILAEQMDRLRTDRIDYYLVHALNGELWEKARKHGVIEFLDGALADGRIRNAGFSFHGSAEDFPRIVDDYDWTFCQIQYNYLDTGNQAGTAGLEYAASKRLAVMIMEPLRGGNLSKPPPPSVKKIWERAERRRTPAEWSLRWIWNRPEVTTVLSGMNVDAHIDENLAVAAEAEPDSLGEGELRLVDEAAAEFRRAMKVGCTGCQYCMPCPAGVNIPSCFDHYNSRHAFRDRGARMTYLLMNGVTTDKPTMASQCVRCGQCAPKCPQNIPIPDRLAEVAKDMEGPLTGLWIWLIKKVMMRRGRRGRRSD